MLYFAALHLGAVAIFQAVTYAIICPTDFAQAVRRWHSECISQTQESSHVQTEKIQTWLAGKSLNSVEVLMGNMSMTRGFCIAMVDCWRVTAVSEVKLAHDTPAAETYGMAS